MANLNLTQREVQVCLRFPPKVNSPGLGGFLLEHNQKDNLLDYAGPTLQLQMACIFALTQSAYFLVKGLGLPMFLAQIFAGIVMGPMVLKHSRDVEFTEENVQVIGSASALGYMLFLFLSAVKMDLGIIFRTGRKGLYLGVLSVLVPLICGVVTIKALIPAGEDIFQDASFFLTVTYSSCSFPVIHLLLTELKILNSELGRLGLAAAVTSDILSLTLQVIGNLLREAHAASYGDAIRDLLLTLAFVAFVTFVLRPAMNWMVRRTPEGTPVKDIYIYAILLGFTMTPAISNLFHIFIIFCPFILGLAVPDGPPLGSALVDKFDCVVSGVFLPLFATTCAMRIDLSHLKFDNPYLTMHMTVAVVVLVVKFVVALVLPMYCNMPKRDSMALAFIMSAKGIVDLGSYTFMSDNQVIPEDIFTFVAILVVVVATIVPLMVKRLYDPSRKYAGYMKRNITHSKFTEELRLLTCIHVPSNVTSIINLLNASCPTRESPLGVYVLHLVKLSGRATPLFISHQKHRKTVSNKSYSENVILAFNQFERDNWGAVTVNLYTAVSPPSLMHEDICNLALDRLISFIVLPFHRRWCADGTIESEDQAIRSLNSSILERAPCSVGILVEGRRHLKRSISKLASDEASYSIAMIFLGGSDDREALFLAKRIAQDTRVSLTVIRLAAANNLGDMLGDYDKMLDNELLRDLQGNGYITYVEEQVNDGPETSTFLKATVNEYHLIIVGRQYNVEHPQTLGLKEWSEFPELGIIGDLLASPDFNGASSVLVVQQQQTTD